MARITNNGGYISLENSSLSAAMWASVANRNSGGVSQCLIGLIQNYHFRINSLCFMGAQAHNRTFYWPIKAHKLIRIMFLCMLMTQQTHILATTDAPLETNAEPSFSSFIPACEWRRSICRKHLISFEDRYSRSFQRGGRYGTLIRIYRQSSAPAKSSSRPQQLRAEDRVPSNNILMLWVRPNNRTSHTVIIMIA